MAEREGFEPPEPFGSTVFKTAAFDHSATSPHPDHIPLTRLPRNPIGIAAGAGEGARVGQPRRVPAPAPLPGALGRLPR